MTQATQTRRLEGKTEETPPRASTKVVEKGKELKEGIDKIIDTIDGVLEENAEEFVKNYVQKGGE